jgi:putative transposase
MSELISPTLAFPIDLAPPPADAPRDLLGQILQEGARKMLAQAIHEEVQVYLAQRAHLRDGQGRHLVVRNGHLPERTIQTPLGDLPVQQPRVRDRRPAQERETFTSAILPPYLRRTRSLEELIPWLYLKGVSTGDMAPALAALLGPGAANPSATTLTRLKAVWEQQYQQWQARSLAGKRYVYVWADGIHFNVRLEDPGNQRQCILVLMGATEQGHKELIAIADGYRESAPSWKELLLDAAHRGLSVPPLLAIGDGGLGFWAAASEVWPGTLQQRCWVHKTANVLAKLPKSLQGKAKAMLHQVWMAPTRVEAERAFALFVASFEAKYPKAVECLSKDAEALLAFYGFPAEHWKHLRTTNPIESAFATVRLRTDKTKGCGSRVACLSMVFKLAQAAQKSWRVLNGQPLLADVIAGVEFVDGVKKKAA